MVAVVVPSPAVSEVLEATSRTICAPAFSSSSFSSISFATVTPSLVIVGEPNFFSMTTLRPRGPSVTLTASASLLTPRRIACRASSLYVILFAIFLISLLDDRENFILANDRVLGVFDLDVGSGVLADQNRVTLFDVELHALALVIELSFADGHDLGLLRLFLGRVRDDDAATDLLLRVFPLHDDTIVERPELQRCCDCCHRYFSFRFYLLELTAAGRRESLLIFDLSC